MYGIFTYIWLISMVNVGKYTIHGSYELGTTAIRQKGTNHHITGLSDIKLPETFSSFCWLPSPSQGPSVAGPKTPNKIRPYIDYRITKPTLDFHKMFGKSETCSRYSPLITGVFWCHWVDIFRFS